MDLLYPFNVCAIRGALANGAASGGLLVEQNKDNLDHKPEGPTISKGLPVTAWKSDPDVTRPSPLQPANHNGVCFLNNVVPT